MKVDKRTMPLQQFAKEQAFSTVSNICVYCGSATGGDSIYVTAAQKLGKALAESSIGLVYGGGSNGLMGALAKSVLAHGGRVTGIIPAFLMSRERPLSELQELIIVNDMHERKRLMHERADAFIALPGGIGTLEELCEQLTWVQLDRHTKPVVIANVGGFWHPLLQLLAHMREQRFIQQPFEVRYLVAEKVEDILPMIQAATAKATLFGTHKETLDPRL